MIITFGYIKSIRVHLLGLMIASCVYFPSLPVRAEPQVEVMHWWHRGGENRAMQVLRDEFELRGGTWFDVSGDDQITVLNTAVSRMAKGYAPTLVQWNSGWEVSQIRQLGLLNSIDPKLVTKLKTQFIDNVMDMVMVDGEIVAIPVNVHSENWLWYKPSNFPSKAAHNMHSWSNFLKYAEARSEFDVVTIAVGDQPWQQRILFNNILLGIAGQSLFQRIYNDLDTSHLTSDRFMEVVQTFRDLKRFSRSFGEGRWDQQVAAVASNKALTVLTGDWAKGEFRDMGLKLGRDYDCTPAPGTSENIMLALDVFALGKVSSANEESGQRMFLDIVTDRAVSETFNYLKGSLSPLRETDVSMLDKCNKIAYQTLDKQGTVIKPYASIGDRGFLASIDHLIAELWMENSDPEIWIESFGKLLLEERSKRNLNNRLSENQQ